MSAAGFSIREARLPEDETVMAGFINGLQKFEYDFEPDRRIDERAGPDYLVDLLKRIRANDGRIFIAEAGGRPVGWAAFHTHENMVYVVPEERRYGYIAELFIEEPYRGRGIGRALIGKCEEATRALKLKLIMIGVLAGNARARKTYEASGFSPYAMELRKYL